MTNLFDAAYSNDVAGVRAAVGEGQSPNAQHALAGTVPLQLACQANALDALEELLRLGADPNLRFSRTSRIDGRRFVAHTPLMYARSVEAIELLLAAGADLEARDEMGRTPLARAAHEGNSALVEHYLDRGADVDVTIAFDGRTVTLVEFVELQRARVLEAAGSEPSRRATERLAALSKIAGMLQIEDIRGDGERP